MVSYILEQTVKNRFVRAARENSKFPNVNLLTNSRRRYMAKILPIRRKTPNNQTVKLTEFTKCENINKSSNSINIIDTVLI